MPARGRRRSRLRRLDRRDGRLCRAAAPGARRAADRMLDERQRRAAIPRSRFRAAVQSLPAHEADNAGQYPPRARDDDPRGDGRARDRRPGPPRRRAHARTGLIPMLHLLIEPIVRAALAEDLGRAGDITSDAVVPAEARIDAVIASRQAGTLAGLDAALLAFELLDPALELKRLCADGARIERGQAVARISGAARPVLAAERTALNLLCRLSGVASATRSLADAIEGHKAKIVCTRKTTPGLRILEKEAVRLGGGANHRFGLDDAMLIKDNHVAMAGGVRPALRRAKAAAGHLVKIELEVDTLDQLAEALEEGFDAVLLDNMDPDTLRRAVAMVGGRAITEASGRITRETAPAIAAAGVDLISSGWITHSAPILDLGLDIA